MKRSVRKLIKEILQAIRKNSGITLSTLERKIGTNPRGLKEHCLLLQDLGLVKITKTKLTTKLYPRKD